MSLKEKIKKKIIHLCGGYTEEELLKEKQIHTIINTEYPIKQYKLDRLYFLNTPKDAIESDVAKSFAEIILNEQLYEARTVNNPEVPNMLKTTYSLYIAAPPKV